MQSELFALRIPAADCKLFKRRHFKLRTSAPLDMRFATSQSERVLIM
jgi:hypothetical protein